jgi:hypothetical protein
LARNGNRFEGDDQSQPDSSLSLGQFMFLAGNEHLIRYDALHNQSFYPSASSEPFSIFALKNGKRLPSIEINHDVRVGHFEIVGNFLYVVKPSENSDENSDYMLQIYNLSEMSNEPVSIDLNKGHYSFDDSFLFPSDSQRLFLLPISLPGDIEIPYLNLETTKLNTLTLGNTRGVKEIQEFGFTGLTAYGYNCTNEKFTIWDVKTGEEITSHKCKKPFSIQLIGSHFILEYDDGEKSVVEYEVGGPFASLKKGTIENRVSAMTLPQPSPPSVEVSTRKWTLLDLLVPALEFLT